MLYYGPLPRTQPELARSLSSALAWAGITAILISAPVIGKVARTSLERTLGTLLGGALALAVAAAASPALFALALPLVAFAGAAGGSALGLEYTGRLFGVTFLVVVSAVLGKPGAAPAFAAAAARAGSILLGVLAVMLASVLLWPASLRVYVWNVAVSSGGGE